MKTENTTHESVASRLTDEEIESYVIQLESSRFCTQEKMEIAAVMRDYVRMRKLMNAVKAKVDAVNAMPSAPLDGGFENQKINGEKMCAKITAFAEITHLLAEAEKGEVK